MDRESAKSMLQGAQVEMGKIGWGTVFLLVLLLIALPLLTFGGSLGLIPQAGAIVLLSLCYYASYTVLHEAVHRNISGGRRNLRFLDGLGGILASLILGIPYTVHRVEHLAHHQNTNGLGDPDRVFGTSPLGLISGIFRLLPSHYFWFYHTVWPKASKVEKGAVLIEFAAIFALRATPVLLGYGEAFLLFSLLPNLLGIALVIIFFAWIVHYPAQATERFKNTRIFHFRGGLRWPVTVLWLWQNYHAIHHLFPRVPFYRYHAVFERIEDNLDREKAPIHRLG